METKDIKLESTAEIVQNESADDKRLNAIKKILVGNQIERIENRFRGLSRRVESSNSHLVSIIEELNQEMASLKLRNKGAGDASASNALNPEVEKLIQDFVDAKKEGKLAEAELASNLQSRLNEIESNINQKVDGSADDMKSEVASFKEKVASSQANFSTNIKNRLGELESNISTQGERLASNQATFSSNIENRLGDLENSISSHQEKFTSSKVTVSSKIANRLGELEDNVSSHQEKLASKQADFSASIENRFGELVESVSSHQEKFASKQAIVSSNIENRLGELEDSVSSQDQIKAGTRLSNLETEIKSLANQKTSGKEFEKKISDRQNNFENDVQELLERLTSRVNERFDFASDERTKLNSQVEGIQKVLENDVVSFMRDSISNSSQFENRLSNTEEQLNNSVKADQVKMLFESLSTKLNEVETSVEQKLKAYQTDPNAIKEVSDRLERKIYENNIRMEAKFDAMYDMTQRQLANRQEDTTKKDALRETLKKLSQLLDE